MAQVSDTFPQQGTTKQPLTWVHRVSQSIVASLWLGPAKAYHDPTHVEDGGEEDTIDYCTCGAGTYI